MDAEVLASRQPIVERGLLEDDADRRANPGGLAANVGAGDAGLAPARGDQRHQHVEQRRLAGAVRAEEREELAVLHREADRADGVELPEGTAELDALHDAHGISTALDASNASSSSLQPSAAASASPSAAASNRSAIASAASGARTPSVSPTV